MKINCSRTFVVSIHPWYIVLVLLILRFNGCVFMHANEIFFQSKTVCTTGRLACTLSFILLETCCKWFIYGLGLQCIQRISLLSVELILFRRSRNPMVSWILAPFEWHQSANEDPRTRIIRNSNASATLLCHIECTHISTRTAKVTCGCPRDPAGACPPSLMCTTHPLPQHSCKGALLVHKWCTPW